MTEHQSFLEVMEAIEHGTSNGDTSITFYWPDDSTEFKINDTELWLISDQYRALEKERDELQDKLDALKRRIEDTLEDF